MSRPDQQQMLQRPRRDCLACGAQTRQATCQVCGSTELGPPRQRFSARQPSDLPAGRFPYGPARIGRPG